MIVCLGKEKVNMFVETFFRDRKIRDAQKGIFAFESSKNWN